MSADYPGIKDQMRAFLRDLRGAVTELVVILGWRCLAWYAITWVVVIFVGVRH